MKYFKSFFKISIILILLIITVGSIYAADNADSTLSDESDDDFSLDEDVDDDSDDEDDFEDDDDSDDEDDFEDDDDSDDDFEDDEDYNESDEDDFEFLEFQIRVYLDRFGNCTDENWTESEDFLNEYQIYLSDPSSYTLNESAEGYETYLKVYNSTVSTFEIYNLTENETAYLKFIIIYYLNHYGNVSANYTWNESDEFTSFHLYKFLSGCFMGSASESMPVIDEASNGFASMSNPFHPTLAASSDLNKTDEASNATEMPNVDTKDNGSWWTYIGVLVLAIAIAVLVIRRV